MKKRKLYPYYEVMIGPLWWNPKQHKWINEPLGGSCNKRRMRSSVKAHNQARHYGGDGFKMVLE